ncbi:MAG: secretin N-terminal domain-containing protein, partial [Bdellovibrionota bacterium]
MRFAKPFLGLLICIFLFGNWQSLRAQSDRSRVVATPPDVDGMFDEEDLEILDEEIEEPLTNVDNSQDFDNEPARITPIRPSNRFNRSSSVSRPQVAGPKTELNFASNIPNPNEKLRMDFIQVDIEELVKYFAERLRKKFIYDPSILSGKITIISPTEVTVAEAYQAFLSAMEIRGYVVFPSGAYLKIEKVAEARKSPVPLYLKSTPDDDSYVTRIINLKYLNVADVRPAVQDLISRSGGAITVHLPTNTLIISDYASNIRRVVRILNILDVEGFQEQLAVIPIEYASASDVAKKISEIFPTGNNNRTTASRTSRTRTSTRAASE